MGLGIMRLISNFTGILIAEGFGLMDVGTGWSLRSIGRYDRILKSFMSIIMIVMMCSVYYILLFMDYPYFQILAFSTLKPLFNI